MSPSVAFPVSKLIGAFVYLAFFPVILFVFGGQLALDRGLSILNHLPAGALQLANTAGSEELGQSAPFTLLC